MVNVGELPTVRYTPRGEKYFTMGSERFGLPIGCIDNTTHIVEQSDESVTCHCCGARVKTYVVKPGSWFHWCLSCY